MKRMLAGQGYRLMTGRCLFADAFDAEIQNHLIPDERCVLAHIEIAAQNPGGAVGAAGLPAIDQHEAAIELADVEYDRLGNPLHAQLAFKPNQPIAIELQPRRPEADVGMIINVKKFSSPQGLVE